ncbi:MAG: Uma2 family endonuclease [Gemmataceae bacterium]|nr:Uma2 family endonuclease [Gemmataceae bacterium]
MIAAKQPIGTPTVASAWPERIHRITLDQYHQMIATGVLQEDDPIELIDGCLVTKAPHDPQHDFAVNRISRLLGEAYGDDAIIRTKSAVTLGNSEPEPDVIAARPPEDEYDDRHPSGSDLFLVVEVANSSVDFDRTAKAEIYSHAGVPEYWIVNVVDRQIEVYRYPRPGHAGGYRDRTIFLASDEVELTLGRKSLAKWKVATLLPKAKLGR